MNKDIVAYKLDKTYVGTYKTVKEVSDKLGIPIGSVYAVTTKNSNRKSTYGYQLLTNGEKPVDLTDANTEAKKSKKVYHYSLDGKELLNVYDSTLEASEKLGDLAQSGVSYICNRKKLTSSTTYNLRFEGDEPQDILSDTFYSAYDLKGKTKLGEYKSLEDALESYGISIEDVKDINQTKYKDIEKGVQIVRNKYLNQVKDITFYVVVDTSSKKEIGRYATMDEVGKRLGVVRERVRQAVSNKNLIKKRYKVDKC